MRRDRPPSTPSEAGAPPRRCRRPRPPGRGAASRRRSAGPSRPLLLEHPLELRGQSGVAVAAAEHEVGVGASRGRLDELVVGKALDDLRRIRAVRPHRQVVHLRLQHAVVVPLDEHLARPGGGGLQVPRADRAGKLTVPAGRHRGVEVGERQSRAAPPASRAPPSAARRGGRSRWRRSRCRAPPAPTR